MVLRAHYTNLLQKPHYILFSVSSSNPNEWALFDLQFDPERLLIADDGALRDAIDGKVKMIRRISVNAQPPLLSTEFTPANVRGGRLPMETYLERARKVRENRVFRHRTSRLLAERYADQPPASYVEQRIYDGFPSHDDEARLAAFHRQEWPRRAKNGFLPPAMFRGSLSPTRLLNLKNSRRRRSANDESNSST